MRRYSPVKRLLGFYVFIFLIALVPRWRNVLLREETCTKITLADIQGRRRRLERVLDLLFKKREKKKWQWDWNSLLTSFAFQEVLHSQGYRKRAHTSWNRHISQWFFVSDIYFNHEIKARISFVQVFSE